MKVKCPVPDCSYETEDIGDTALLNTLLGLHATTHAAPQAEKLQRPTISPPVNSEDWAYFIIRWEEYRVGCRLDGPDVVLQLLECCTEELRRDLVHTEGRSLSKKSEKEVLQAIRNLAVHKENIIASGAALCNVHQGKDKPIRSFTTKIKGKACTCKVCNKMTNAGDCVLLNATFP